MTKRSPIKTGMLAALLLIPVLFVLFLYNFGQNHFALPVFYPNGLSGEEKGQVHRIPDFQLVDQLGKPFGRKHMEGKITIADFIFTRCQTICPRMTSELTRVQEAFKNEPDVIIMSTSVDPEFDQPEVLKAYAEGFRAIPGKWYFLTGPRQKIYDLVKGGFVLPVEEGDSTSTDLVAHSERVVLVDKEGRIRGYYNGTDPAKVDTLIVETRVLLQEYGK